MKKLILALASALPFAAALSAGTAFAQQVCDSPDDPQPESGVCVEEGLKSRRVTIVELGSLASYVVNVGISTSNYQIKQFPNGGIVERGEFDWEEDLGLGKFSIVGVGGIIDYGSLRKGRASFHTDVTSSAAEHKCDVKMKMSGETTPGRRTGTVYKFVASYVSVYVPNSPSTDHYGCFVVNSSVKFQPM